MYYIKFSWHYICIALFVYLLFIVSRNMIYGVMDILDIVLAIMLMTLGALSIITDEVIKLIEIRYKKEIEKFKILKEEERKDTPTGTCPECQGNGTCSWSSNETPMTCWKCSGSGKV